MKKQVLSLLMALVLCLAMLPTEALAKEAGVAQEVQSIADAGNAYADGGDIEQPDGKNGNVSGGNADGSGETQNGEADTDVSAVQALIDALPENAPAALAANVADKPQGEGTESSPCLIGTLAELQWLRDTVNSGTANIHAKLTADIKDIPDSVKWEPIGTQDSPYTGTFDGNGFQIEFEGLPSSQGEIKDWGLFGYIGSAGKIQDLNVYINYFGDSRGYHQISKSGMLAAYNAGTIERCTATNSREIYVTGAVGLLVYQNSGTVEDCLTKLVKKIGSGAESVGGIAYKNDGSIKTCFFNGGYQSESLNSHTIVVNGTGGSIANCYFISGRNYTDSTTGVESVSGDDVTSGKLTVLLNNDGVATGSETEPWRIDASKYPSLKKTDSRAYYENGNYVVADKPHMHGDQEFAKVTSLPDITTGGRYYIAAAMSLDSTWTVSGDVVLCLNGNTITAKSGITAIEIGEGASLTLMDCSKDGTGKLTGGEIGVLVNGGSFSMQAGEISGCATGVSVQGGTLTLSGKAKATENTRNILLAENQKISFGELDASAKFGISVADQDKLTSDTRVTVTDATGGQYQGQLVADGFQEDGTGFELYLGEDGATVTLGRQSGHKHKIGETEVTFQPWTQTDSLPKTGNYYLTRNVTLSKSADLQGVNLCLNGYTVTMPQKTQKIQAGAPSASNRWGSLTDCTGKGTVTGSGSVFIQFGGTINLYGGALNGTHVEISQSGGTFNMYGGKITNYRGTVSAVSGQSGKTIFINLYGGEISGNHVSAESGGVWIGAGNQFKMYGGTIRDNTGTSAGGVGFTTGNTTYGNGMMTISGNAVIQNNKVGSSQSNVCLPSGNTITVEAALESTARIGVTKSGTLPLTIATATEAGWVAMDNFTSDSSAYRTGLTEDGKTVQLQAHEHTWTYTANDATITATCSDCSTSGSMTIAEPTNLTYNGEGKAAVVTASNDWPGPAVDGITPGYIKIGKYGPENLENGSLPTDVGNYTASITVEGETASVEYTIQPKTVAADDVIITNNHTTYDGTTKNVIEFLEVTVDGKKLTPLKDFSITNGITSSATAATTPKRAQLELKGNYANENNEPVAFQWYIDPLEAQLELVNADDRKYGDGKGNVTLKVANAPSFDTVNVTCTGGDDLSVGSHSVTATALDNHNYKLSDDSTKLTFTYSVAKGTKPEDQEQTMYVYNNVAKTYKYVFKPVLPMPSAGLTFGTVNCSLQENGITCLPEWISNGQTVYENNALTFKTNNTSSTEGTVILTAKVVVQSDNYEDFNMTFNVKTKDKPELAIAESDITMVGWTYGQTPTTPNVSSLPEGATLTATYKNADGKDITPSSTTDAGKYTVTVRYEADEAVYTGTKEFIIGKRIIGITDVTFVNKTYDGTDDAASCVTAVTFDNLPEGVTFTKDTDYYIDHSSHYNSAEVKNANAAIVNVNLKEDSFKNYAFRWNGSDNQPHAEFKKNDVGIYKVTLPTATAGELTIINGLDRTWSFDLSTLLPKLDGPMEYGDVQYKIGSYILDPDYYTTENAAGIEDGRLKLPILASTKTGDVNVGTVTVKVTSDNADDFTLKIHVKASDKIVPALKGELNLSKTELSYGEKLSTITISGTMTNPITNETVTGTFAWDTPDKTMDAVGKYDAAWKFVPNNTDIYAETAGAVTITVNKVTPAGAPTYTTIIASGKKLSDAALKANDTWPAGTLEWVDDKDNVLQGDTEVKVNTSYKWRFTPTDTNYNILTGEIELYHMDAPAISAQPKSVSVITGEKATFEITATGTNITYQWKIDRNDGKGFVDINGANGASYTTGVTDMDCNGFRYQCVISNAVGSVTTAVVTLTVTDKIAPTPTPDPYRIIEGANGSWTQSTDGSGSLLIRGNGEFSKFLNVKVDGTIIDPTNYTAREGSTIIELHADYLKTLSEGSHTFEIAWTDGTAGTSFTVAKNTSGSDDTGSNDNDDSNKDSNNDSGNNNSGSNNTAGSGDNTAQTLTGSPNTGDASGLWIALFLASAAGLVVMLVRRKK